MQGICHETTLKLNGIFNFVGSVADNQKYPELDINH